MPVAPGRYAVLVHPREISDGTAVPGRRTGRLGTLVRDLLNICELAIFGDPNACFWRNASINVLLFSDRYVTCKLALVEHRKSQHPMAVLQHSPFTATSIVQTLFLHSP